MNWACVDVKHPEFSQQTQKAVPSRCFLLQDLQLVMWSPRVHSDTRSSLQQTPINFYVSQQTLTTLCSLIEQYM